MTYGLEPRPLCDRPFNLTRKLFNVGQTLHRRATPLLRFVPISNSYLRTNCPCNEYCFYLNYARCEFSSFYRANNSWKTITMSYQVLTYVTLKNIWDLSDLLFFVFRNNEPEINKYKNSSASKAVFSAVCVEHDGCPLISFQHFILFL